MKTYVFVEKKTSLIISTATYPSDHYMNPLETHPDYVCIELHAPLPPETIEHLYYKEGALKLKPEAPGKFHRWNVDTEMYEEDLEEAKEHYLKELRIASRHGEGKQKVFYRNVWYNSTAQAESDLVSAILTEAFPQEWRGLDNTKILLTQEEAVVLLNKIREARLNYKKQYWHLKDLVEKATKVSEVPLTAIQEFVAIHSSNTVKARRIPI